MSGEGMWGMIKTDAEAFFGGQMRTYAMWCNQKLSLAGEPDSIPFDKTKMTEKFSDGTFIAKMLQILDDEKIKSIKWKPNKLKVFWTENLRICWRHMRSKNIDLGGINTTTIIGGQHLGTVLALIWRWIKKYDMVDGSGELLRWCQEHTGTHATVENFTNSWADGVAFLELYSNLFEGKATDKNSVHTVNVDEWKGRQVEERLEAAFEFFEDTLQVPKMLLVQDLTDPEDGRIDQTQVQAYLATIRVEYNKWHDKWVEEQQNAVGESQQHENDGDTLFKYGMNAFTNQKSETDVVIKKIVNEIQDQLALAQPPVDYDQFTVSCKDRFVEETPGFEVAIEKFTEAKDEYSKVTHHDVTDKKDKCDTKIDEVNKYRDSFGVTIETLLEDVYAVDRADRFYSDCVDHFDTVIEEGGQTIITIIDETVEELEKCTREEERERVAKEAIVRIEEWTTIFDPLKDEFVEAEALYPDQCVDEKYKCVQKREEIDNMITEFKELGNRRIAEEMEKIHPNDVLTEDELLQLYHDTTVAIDATATNSAPTDPGLQTMIADPTTCQDRLDDILEKVKGVWGDSESLRKKVHDQVDSVFNANGYNCVNGTDCCADCKVGRG
jgi:hypothetical protein